MSEKTITWEVEEGGPVYELFIKHGKAFMEFRLFYKEAGRIKSTSSLSLPNEMLPELKNVIANI